MRRTVSHVALKALVTQLLGRGSKELRKVGSTLRFVSTVTKLEQSLTGGSWTLVFIGVTRAPRRLLHRSFFYHCLHYDASFRECFSPGASNDSLFSRLVKVRS